MTDHELPCLHCVVSDLIHKNIPGGIYPAQESVRSMIEVTLDMIAAADPREQQALYTSTTILLADGFRDIVLGQYKAKAFNGEETS